MAKYQQYEEYKESGIEWVEEIPKSWSSVSLRWISTIYSGGTPSKTNLSYWEDGTIPWLNSGTVNQGLIVDPSTYITNDALQNSSAKWIPKGSLVLALAGQGKTKGMVAQTGIDTTCNQSMAAIVFNEKKFARFIFWWLTSNYQNIRNMAGGDLRDGLNLEHLGSIQCPQPSIDEAIKITGFLDHETAQIDTLIDKQQALIQLLKEKRQAVISHAVTKGLNPNAPMKDSGVEWLGEVPEHWEVRKLKYVCDLITKKTEIHNQYVIALENIESWTGNFVSSDSNYSGQDVGFDTGDILFSKLRPYLAKVYLAQAEGVAFGDLLVYRPKKELLNKYGFYLMTNEGFINTVNSSTYGSKMPRASTEFISEMPVVIPLLQEQKQIVAYVDKILARFDSLVLKAETAIQLMQERRTALISAAVTGKIDVRGWQAPESKTTLELL